MVMDMTEHTAHDARDANAAALHILADAVKLEQLPVPHGIDIWAYGLPKSQFTMWADRLAARIDVREGQEGCVAHAVFNCTVDAGRLPGTARIEFHAFCDQVSPGARAEYETHNKVCVL